MEKAHHLPVIREDETELEEDLDEKMSKEEMSIRLSLLQLEEEDAIAIRQGSRKNVAATNTSTENPNNVNRKVSVGSELDYSIPKQGQCSGCIDDTFNCSICMEAVQTKEVFYINPCMHIFCTSCMIQYLTVKTEENAVPIPCPTPGCKTKSIDPATCQDILPVDTLNRWSLALYELSLGQKKLYCPFKDCSAMLIDEGEDSGENITNCECPHCQRIFCAMCKVPWHVNISCEEFEKLGEDEKGREDLMLRDLAKNKRWQRCPKCRMYVEKIDGCTYLRCRCGYRFCYGCAGPMSDDPRHYCEKCKRTW